MTAILAKCFLLFFTLSLAACTDEGAALAGLQVGATKAEIRSAAGDPDAQEMVTKHEEAIWGPEEAFWHEIRVGERLERWVYVTDEGQYRLYFRQAETRLAFKVFEPEGVVYESGG